MSPKMMTKASKTGQSLYLQTMGRPAWTPRDYAALSRESYQMNAVSYRCVRLVAEAAAQMPFLVREGGKEMETHPFLDLIKRPNPFESRQELLVRLYSFLMLAGNAYLEPNILDQKVRELFVLRPDRMKVVPGPKGYPVKYIYQVGQKSVEFQVPSKTGDQLPILHIKEFHPTDDHYGMSPVEAAAYSIDVHNQSNVFSKALLDNMARPSGALVYSGGESGTEALSDEQFTRLKKELEERYQGAKNAGRPLLLDGGLDWKEMSLAPKDMEYSEAKQQSARDIALSFGVPPQLLGIPGDNTYTNYSQAVRALYRQTVIPLVTHVCGDLTNFFMPTYGEDFEVITDLDSLEALADERKELWDRVEKSTVITLDEKREALGYDKAKDRKVGQAIWAPMNEMPRNADRPDPGTGKEPSSDDPFDEEDDAGGGNA
jgi:HK97 family phage portal protein